MVEVRELPILHDSKIQNLAAFADMKQGAGSTMLGSVNGSSGSTLGIKELRFLNDSKSQTCAIFDIKQEAGRVVLNKVTGNPAASKFGELPFLKDSKIQKQRVVDSAASSSSTGKPMPSIREARKP